MSSLKTSLRIKYNDVYLIKCHFTYARNSDMNLFSFYDLTWISLLKFHSLSKSQLCQLNTYMDPCHRRHQENIKWTSLCKSRKVLWNHQKSNSAKSAFCTNFMSASWTKQCLSWKKTVPLCERCKKQQVTSVGKRKNLRVPPMTSRSRGRGDLSTELRWVSWIGE